MGRVYLLGQRQANLSRLRSSGDHRGGSDRQLRDQQNQLVTRQAGCNSIGNGVKSGVTNWRQHRRTP